MGARRLSPVGGTASGGVGRTLGGPAADPDLGHRRRLLNAFSTRAEPWPVLGSMPGSVPGVGRTAVRQGRLRRPQSQGALRPVLSSHPLEEADYEGSKPDALWSFSSLAPTPRGCCEVAAGPEHPRPTDTLPRWLPAAAQGRSSLPLGPRLFVRKPGFGSRARAGSQLCAGTPRASSFRKHSFHDWEVEGTHTPWAVHTPALRARLADTPAALCSPFLPRPKPGAGPHTRAASPSVGRAVSSLLPELSGLMPPCTPRPRLSPSLWLLSLLPCLLPCHLKLFPRLPASWALPGVTSPSPPTLPSSLTLD